MLARRARIPVCAQVRRASHSTSVPSLVSIGRVADIVSIRDLRVSTVIGVYDWDLASFLEALACAQVRLLIDVRQRRGVRGPVYAWANSARLQAALAAAGIAYRHHKELAPTTELRHLQYAEDARRGEGKRSRTVLAPEYATRYTREILDPA